MAERVQRALPPSTEIADASKTVMDIVNDQIRYQDEKGIEDPFAIVNLSDIVAKYERWNCLFPRVKPFYAVKCFDDESIVRLMADLGAGFDCASKSEIEKVLNLGVSPDRIVYSHTCKQRDMLAFARDNDVHLMTFDNEDELRKVKATSPAAQLLLRIRPPATDKVFTNLGGKFGCPPYQVRVLLEIAKSLGLNVVGISYHVGSGCYDTAAFANAVIAAAAAADVARDVGFTVSVLDIGGGFPGHNLEAISLEDIAAAIVPALDAHFPESSGVRLISEPGRFFVASAVQLTAKIIGKRLDYIEEPAESASRDSAVTASPNRALYYINDGFYCSFLRDTLGKRVPYPVILPSWSRPQERPVRKLQSTVYGPTCDGGDVILEAVDLPEALLDDWMSFANMGAYSLSVATAFNGMPKPRLYFVIFSDAI